MNINNIDFPNHIIDAIRDDELVVFVGAGVSMGKPTSLPNFEDLTNKIAEGTDRTKSENETFEVFLGSLKAEGIDVNRIAASLLSSTSLKHNGLHEAIVDLFPSADKVRIVTTNYDQMLEQVFEERLERVEVYNSPAIPLGDDFSGIVHVHGNVCNPKYMVVTDEDFGKAYLTERYAARFLVKLFETYTILFVGYSYNDTIMRYLTRAMHRNNSDKRYILTSDMEASWGSLGINVISYPKGRYDIMESSLVKLGNYAKKGLLDWQTQFEEIADYPPKDLTINSELEYCLDSIERARVVANTIHGKEWLELLDNNNVFSGSFSDACPMTDKDSLWANWLSDKFIGSDDSSLINLIAKHGNRLNDQFSELLIRKVIQKENQISDEFYKKYITVLNSNHVDSWTVFRLIQIAHTRKMYHLSLRLFKRLYTVSIGFEKNLWVHDEKWDPKHSILGDYYITNQSWELISEAVVQEYALEILSFVERTIEEIHYLYEGMGYASNTEEPFDMSMLIIEDRVKDHSKKPVHVLIQAYLQATKHINNSDLLIYLKRDLNSESLLLRKIALRAIRETDCFNSDEIIDMICDKSLLWSFGEHEQIFLLARKAFEDASIEKQNRFLNAVEEGPACYKDERNQKYAVYNWCVWLKGSNHSNKQIESIITEYENTYGFAPREHPELDVVVSDAVWVKDESPVSSDDMFEMPVEELVSLLLNYKETSYEAPTRWALLNVFVDAVKKNPQWAHVVTGHLFSNSIINKDIWSSLFRGLGEANLTIAEALNWCKELSRNVEIVPDVKDVSYYLWKVLQRKEMQNEFKEWEDVLFDLSLQLWGRRDTESPPTMRLIDRTFNSTTGILLLCWTHMVSYSENGRIPEQYKDLFEKALQLRSWEQEISICVLAGHFNFLCSRDRSWSISKLEPMLTSENKNHFINAWEGIVYFSRRIYLDTADIITQIYRKAAKQVNWLEGEARDGFIDLYLTLLIYVVKEPTKEFIPVLYKSASEDNQNQFVKAISYRLINMTLEAKTNLWNNWLRQFLINRKDNKPVKLSESECVSLFMLLPQLDFVIKDAVDIICKGEIPTSIDSMFWYELNKQKLASNHPHSIAKLMISLLGSINDLGYGEVYMNEIISALKGLDGHEKKQLQEILLKHGITATLC